MIKLELKIFFILFLIVVTFLTTSSFVDAYGLSCAAPNVTQSFEESDVIFSGKAISKEYLKSFDEHTLIAETLFSIKESFKGTNQDFVKVTSNEKFWGINFTEGSDYLIFGDIVDKEIQSQICGPTNLVQYSDIDLVREISLNISKNLFEKCVKGSYEKDFGLGDWQVIIRNQENDICIMNIYWNAEADSIEYFCKVPFNELKNSDWQISSHPLFNLEQNCTVIKKKSLMLEDSEYVLPPKKQTELGLKNNEIVCRDKMELIFRADNNSPACVKVKSVQKLIEWGWASSVEKNLSKMNVQNDNFMREIKEVTTFLSQYPNATISEDTSGSDSIDFRQEIEIEQNLEINPFIRLRVFSDTGDILLECWDGITSQVVYGKDEVTDFLNNKSCEIRIFENQNIR